MARFTYLIKGTGVNLNIYEIAFGRGEAISRTSLDLVELAEQRARMYGYCRTTSLIVFYE